MIDISLLICTRNRSRSLGATLESVAVAAHRASPGGIELILVDNGSTDGTAAIARRSKRSTTWPDTKTSSTIGRNCASPTSPRESGLRVSS